MSEVRVCQSHDLSVEEAKGRVAAFEEMMKKYGVKAKWKGDAADLKGVGVSGSLTVSSSDVTVVLKLGMLAKAAGVDASRLQGSIERRLRAGLNRES